MGCSWTQRWIVRRLDQEAVGWRRWFLDRHLVRCAKCRRFFEAQRDLGPILPASLPVPSTPEQWPAILAALETSGEARDTWGERLRRVWSSRPGRLVTACTFAVVLVFGAVATTMGHAALDDLQSRHGAGCPEVGGVFGDLPVDSPGRGISELLERHLDRRLGGGAR